MNSVNEIAVFLELSLSGDSEIGHIVLEISRYQSIMSLKKIVYLHKSYF